MRYDDWDAPSSKSRKPRQQGQRPPVHRENKPVEQRRPVEHRPPVAQQRPQQSSGLRKFIITLVIIVGIFLLAWYLCVHMVYSKLNTVDQKDLSGSAAEAFDGPLTEDGVTNILLIGLDSRDGVSGTRSDSMILLSISKNTKKITMTSLLRDMYVEIPGHDGNRLNAAYSFGGAALLLETVEKNLGITVNDYVEVDFFAFIDLVDCVSGVDLELTAEEIKWVNAYLDEYNILMGYDYGTGYLDASSGGVVHLDGAHALAYCRNRSVGSDFGRTERQRKVLTAVMKKLPKAALKNPTGVAEKLMKNLTTNLTEGEAYRLSFTAFKLPVYEMESYVIPKEGTYKDATIRQMAVLEVDFEANRQYLQELLYEKGE